MRTYTLTSRIHVHKLPSILLYSKLSRFSSFELRVEPCENLIVANIWSRHSGRMEKSILDLIQLLNKTVIQAKNFKSKRNSRKYKIRRTFIFCETNSSKFLLNFIKCNLNNVTLYNYTI